MYRAMELIVPSLINDFQNGLVLSHSILVCCLYLLRCLIHSLINLTHSQSFPICQLQHLKQWLNNLHNLCCLFPKYVFINFLSHIFVILFASPLTSISLSTGKHPLQVSMLGKHRLQCQKMNCKSSDGRPNKILAPCVFPHQVQNP